MSQRLLQVTGLCKSFDGVTALHEFSCDVGRGEIVGLIGPNGAGKTTLFNVVTRFIVPDAGKVTFQGRNLNGLTPDRIANAGISRTFQDLRLVRRLSVLENVLVCFPGQPGESLANIFFRWRECQRREQANRALAMELLQGVGLEEKADDPSQNLSYGQQKLLSLVCCLATGARLLLLDEPVAGIAPAMAEKILEELAGLPGQDRSVILIEHDLDAVAQVCGRVIFMDSGAKVSEGTPQEVRDDPRVIEAYID